MVRGKCFRKWEKNLSGFWTSGLTLAEYCRRTHLNEKSAGRWMNRFKSLGYEKKVTQGNLEIVPLKTVLTAGFTSGEKTILPDDSHSAIESFGRIVVDIEAWIFQENR